VVIIKDGVIGKVYNALLLDREENKRKIKEGIKLYFILTFSRM